MATALPGRVTIEPRHVEPRDRFEVADSPGGVSIPVSPVHPASPGDDAPAPDAEEHES
jgi:hypothetical protein